MEDNLSFWKRKTTLIFLQIEDDLNFLKTKTNEMQPKTIKSNKK